MMKVGRHPCLVPDLRVKAFSLSPLDSCYLWGFHGCPISDLGHLESYFYLQKNPLEFPLLHICWWKTHSSFLMFFLYLHSWKMRFPNIENCALAAISLLHLDDTIPLSSAFRCRWPPPAAPVKVISVSLAVIKNSPCLWFSAMSSCV